MRRTITTLMFLAVGGLAFALQAADPGQASGNYNYYAASQSRYRISDDDDGSSTSNATEESTVSNAVGQAQTTSQDKNAVYLSNNAKSAGELLQTNYFAGAGQAACGCENNCCGNSCCNNNCCGNLSDCCDCDCSINSFRIEMLGWFSRGRSTPPLVTTSSAADGGVIGAGSTTTLYGNDPIGGGIRAGGRATFNHLFSDNITTGTVRFWGLEDKSVAFVTDSTTNAVIGRPFFNTALGQNDAFLVASPGITDPGSIRVLSKNDLIGADAWLSRNLYNDGCSSIDVLGGYQFTRLDDSLAISSNSTVIDPLAANVGVAPGTVVSIFDSFRTQNEFHGASMGVIARSYRGPVTLEGLFKVAMGSMRQAVIVNGNTSITPPGGATTTTPGGLLAQPTNIGSQQEHRFAFSPEVNLNVVYNLDANWRVLGGYSFIYWNSVVMAGNQIDTSINTTQNPALGGLSPQPKFQRTDFWVQGINLGAEYRW